MLDVSILLDVARISIEDGSTNISIFAFGTGPFINSSIFIISLAVSEIY
jgi:preprotein translocase subunit SecY